MRAGVVPVAALDGSSDPGARSGAVPAHPFPRPAGAGRGLGHAAVHQRRKPPASQWPMPLTCQRRNARRSHWAAVPAVASASPPPALSVFAKPSIADRPLT
eukprot:7385823-Prymnesium_polylepis.1